MSSAASSAISTERSSIRSPVPIAQRARRPAGTNCAARSRVAPHSPTVGVPAAAARCISPESLPTYSAQRRRHAVTSGNANCPVVSIASGSSRARTVPAPAVVSRDGFNYVMQVKADNRVSLVKVQTGRRVGDQIEITQGLTEGVKLVTQGAGFLNDGDTVRIAP